MSNYKSDKQTPAVIKQRAGEIKTNNIKSSGYLPGTLQTDLNAKWLDATLDQMISKGDLETIDAYVGSRSSKYQNPGDFYLQESAHTQDRRLRQLAPAIITRDTAGDVVTALSVDDIANRVNQEFPNYSYTAAYSTESYVFRPPINEDKFINYSMYYWAPDLPVYTTNNIGEVTFFPDGLSDKFHFVDYREVTQVLLDGVPLTDPLDYVIGSDNVITTTVPPAAGSEITLVGAPIAYTTDFATDIRQNAVWRLIDDEVSVELQDGMLIKIGAGYDPEITGITYLVAGVGVSIRLIPHTVINPVTGQEIVRWQDTTIYKPSTQDYWDSAQVRRLTTITGQTNPQDVIDYYNINMPDPMLKLRFGDTNKNEYVRNNMVVRIDETWSDLQPLDTYRVFVLNVLAGGTVTMTTIIDAQATPSGVEQFIPAGLSKRHLELVAELQNNWDTITWDKKYLASTDKDYIVIDRADYISTAWSRVNQWVHKSTLIDIASMVPGMRLETFLQSSRQAKRPIIEFGPLIELMNAGNRSVPVRVDPETVWKGPINYILSLKNQIPSLYPGSTYVLRNSPKIFRREDGVFTAQEIAIGVDYTIVDAGTSDFTLIGAPDNNPGTPFTATSSGTSGTGTVSGYARSIDEMVLNDTLLILDSTQPPLAEEFRSQDAYWNGTEIVRSQIKAVPNQPPLFVLRDSAGVRLDDAVKYPESNFRGNTVFAYKMDELTKQAMWERSTLGYVTDFTAQQLASATTTVDTELDFALTYRDMGIRADIVFENSAMSEKYQFTVTTHTGNSIGRRRDIPGYYAFARNNDSRLTYAPSYLPLGAKTQEQHTVTTYVYPFVDDLLSGTTGMTTYASSILLSDYPAIKVFVEGIETTDFTVNEYTITLGTQPPVGTNNIEIRVSYAQVPTGSDSWITQNEFVLYRNGGTGFTLDELYTDGVYKRSKLQNPDITVAAGGSYKFHDLIGTADNPTNRLTVYLNDGLTPVSESLMVREDLNNDGYPETVTFNVPADGIDSVYYYGYPDDFVNARLTVVDSLNYLYHSLVVNGKSYFENQYIIQPDVIYVPAKFAPVGSLIDLEYQSSNTTTSSLNTIVPDSHRLNSTNSYLTEFTISETLGHWTSIIEATSNFQGQSFGENNSFKNITKGSAAGNIIMHTDISVMHDLSYGDTTLDLGTALNQQARDWWAFKLRFVSQVRRLFTVNSYATVRDLVNDAIDAIVVNRRGTELYADSNMLYSYRDKTDTITLDVTDPAYSNSFFTKFTLNCDRTQTDHMYVYLTENKGLGGKFIERLLVKDRDYTVNGSKITLAETPLANGEALPYVTVFWHDMDSASHVPPSIAKLSLSHTTIPRLYAGELICHDGDRHAYTPGAELDDVTSSIFDPVTAALYELEKRVYSGIGDLNRTTTFNKYLPSQHRSTWYTLQTIDNYIEKYFVQWHAIDNEPLTPDNYYELTDSTTWNYSTINLGEHLSTSRLPGHWKGAYTVLFGTYTPHLTPWIMLGINSKPDWWDDHYPSAEVSGSWAAGAKRTALLEALKRGIVSNPADTIKQQVTVAYYYWDWDNKCPVSEFGDLVPPYQVLGTPATVDAAQPFVYGDWGPTEIKWRNSALGQAAMVSAIVKLNPTRAWSDFFQPDYIVTTDDATNPLNVTQNSLEFVNPQSFYYPGNSYQRYIKRVDVVMSTDGWGADSTIRFLNGHSRVSAQAVLNINDAGEITHVTMQGRGIEYQEMPVADVINSSIANGAVVDLDIVLGERPFVTNGICQAQRNAILRNNLATDIEQQYYSIDTQLLQKIAGFTSKDLINFYTESGPNGAFRINENDLELIMYAGTPTEINVASLVNITKLTTGFRVSGVSNALQQFMFNLPVVTGNNDFVYVTLSDTTTVKKYSRFSSEASILEFNTVLNKIQDTYNFVRGYRNYLENKGFVFGNDKDAEAAAFAQWAVNAELNEVYTVKLGNSISYVPVHGHVLEFDALPENVNSILDPSRNRIDSTLLSVSRSRDLVTIAIKDDFAELGSVGIAEADYEHAVVFANTTQFNQVIFDDVLNARQWRLRMEGRRTADWDGNRRAPGYLVFDNRIVKNFDSSVQYVDDYYRTDVDKFNPGIAKAERLTNGNVDRQWVNDLNLPNRTVSDFYKGAIRQAGTSDIIGRIGRSNLINSGTSTITAHEEWMFRHSYFGDTGKTKSTEIEISQALIKSSPQIINLDDPSIVFVNKQSDFDFAVKTFQEYTEGNYAVLRTAGPLLDTDARYTARTVDDLEGVFDPTAEYATVPTWDSVTSYKLGDHVRHNGIMYTCAVSAIGYTPVSSDLVFTGFKDNPVFEYASALAGDDPSAIIDGTPIWFDTTAREYNNIVVTGTNAGATVASPSEITIDGVTVPLVYTPDTPIVDVTAEEFGNPYVRSSADLPLLALPDTAGKTLIINGVTVLLYDVYKPADGTENYLGADITPAPVIENFVGVLSQTDFTIATVLSPTTYAVTDVTVDSVPQLEGSDYTVTGQTLSFTVAPTAGAAIQVTITHDTVLQTVFPVTQPLVDDTLNNYVWSVSAVTVDSVTQTLGVDYTVNTSLNQVEFINAPADGSAVAFTIHARHYQSIQDIVDTINAASISGGFVTASIYATYKIQITYDVQSNASLNLIIGTGTANADLGFTANTYAPATVLAPVDSPMSASVIAGLINTSGLMPNTTIASASITGELIITKEPTTATTVTTTLSISGPVRLAMGLPLSTPVTYADVPVSSNAAQAAAIINAYGIPGISAIVADVYLQVISINESVDLGDENNNMNFAAGIPGGVYYRTNTVVENVFDEADWTVVETDPACFNIWLTNDSGMQNITSTTDGILSKFNGWNVLQVQDFGYYTTDTDPGCSICAGTTTSDGNDARITLNAPHNLAVGDYVMLVNTTTKPNIDGIHRVTKLGNPGEENRFYIDRFIEECGSAPNVFVLRNARFNSIADMNSTLTSDYYRWKTNAKVFVHRNAAGFPSNNVYRFNGSIFELILNRYKDSRVINSTIDNVLIYDNDLKQTIIELELFDPVRGIIPGVADRELDSKGPIDLAVYTDSTDISFTGDERGAWGNGQVGKTWWNTNNVRYYDYDQSDIEYRTAHWGKLFPGSTIDVYEWTKSLVPPDEWSAAVKAQSNQFGVPATGTAYSVFDPTTNENVYYYTELEEWNSSLGKYETVYYFWVKDKTNVTRTDRRLTVKQIASIIQDPTANGIVWCAVVSSSAESNAYVSYDNVIIVSNVGYYLNSNASVLQINKKLDRQAHSSWTIISEGNDYISEYWYAGIRDNLVGIQSGTNIKFPNYLLHEYNRYGDDRALGQGWFTDTKQARREAVTIANRMLKNMNIVQELGQKWFRCIGPDNHVTDIEQSANAIPDWVPGASYNIGDQVIWNKKVYEATTTHVSSLSARTEFVDPASGWVVVSSIYDLSIMWDYADYVEPIRDPAQVPSKYLLSLTDLATVDKSQHSLVMVKFYNEQLRHDESEIYQLVNNEWFLVEKKNATIQFNNFVWDPTNDIAWDTVDWDVGAWDADTSVYMWYLIRALREDLFIQKFLDNFNTFFFGVVKYAISQQKQVDWVYKTTYLQVEIETPFDTRLRKYTKSGVESVEGFINTVKPFHTKIRSVFDTYTQNEQVVAHVNDSWNTTVTMLFNQFQTPSETQHGDVTALNLPVYGGDTVSGGSFTDILEDGYAGAAFTDITAPDTEINGDVFLNVSQYNHVTFTDGSSTGDAQRRTLFNADFVEHLSIAVQTAYDAAIPNPIDTNGRTHVYLQDNGLGVSAFGLELANAGTLDALVSNTADTFELTVGDGAKFGATGGYAWLGGELVRYGQVIGDTMMFVDRGINGSLPKTHAVATAIVNVSGSQLSTIASIAQQLGDSGAYITAVRFNALGKSLLDTTADTVEAKQLQATTTGIDL